MYAEHTEARFTKSILYYFFGKRHRHNTKLLLSEFVGNFIERRSNETATIVTLCWLPSRHAVNCFFFVNRLNRYWVMVCFIH